MPGSNVIRGDSDQGMTDWMVGRRARDRLPGVFLAASVAVVLVAWDATLVYLGFRFL